MLLRSGANNPMRTDGGFEALFARRWKSREDVQKERGALQLLGRSF